jgi:hypothetical protein
MCFTKKLEERIGQKFLILADVIKDTFTELYDSINKNNNLIQNDIDKAKASIEQNQKTLYQINDNVNKGFISSTKQLADEHQMIMSQLKEICHLQVQQEEKINEINSKLDSLRTLDEDIIAMLREIKNK